MQKPSRRLRLRRRPTLIGLAAVTAAVMAVTVTQFWGPTAEAESVEGAPSPGRSAAVTLITGDQVVFQPDNPGYTPQVLAADGREDIVFRVNRDSAGLHVVPADAEPLLDNGTLDPRLFNVSALVEMGYDDATRPDVPLIVRTSTPATLDTWAAADVNLTSLGLSTANPEKSTATDFWSTVVSPDPSTLDSGVREIWLDGKRRLLLQDSVPRIGAPAVWESGYDGDGVTVAVLDSGVDPDHPDLAGRVIEARDFTGADDPTDRHGHGTHVAATIAGGGEASDGRHRGVAPGAELLSGKVCGMEECTESDLLAGMLWAAQSDAAIVNMSIGGSDFPGIDPLEAAVNDLTDQYDTLFVIAAGNYGFHEKVDSPGSADAALTVAAADLDGAVAEFSSRGPRTGDHALKPDLMAPGVDIVAARAAGTAMGEPVDDHYTSASGTSMATPHVAGAVALLLQKHPGLSPEDIKSRMTGSAVPSEGFGAHEQGAGMIDASTAVNQTITSQPASVSVGLHEWPQLPDNATSHSVEYINTGDADVELTVTFTPAGPSAPGMFTLDTDRITVPADGSATIEITVDTSVVDEAGEYGGHLRAEGADQAVTTALAVTKAEETRDLTLRLTDRNGAPATETDVTLHNHDTGDAIYLDVDQPEYVAKVPPGRYMLEVTVYTGSDLSLMVHPDLDLTESVELDLDARTAEPVNISVDNDEAVNRISVVSYQTTGESNLFGALATDSFARLSTAAIDPDAAEMITGFSGGWAILDDNGGSTGSTKTYSLGYLTEGAFPTGFTASPETEDLAEVTVTQRSEGTGLNAALGWNANHPSTGFVVGSAMRVDLPIIRTEYRNVEEGLTYSIQNTLTEIGDFPIIAAIEERPVVEYQQGGKYREIWNAAVRGPAIPNSSVATRTGDTIDLAIPMYSSAADLYSDSAGVGTTRLYQGEQLLGEEYGAGWGSFAGLSVEATEYRLIADLYQGLSDLATQVTSEWTFTSAADQTTIPLLAVRFDVQDLDDHNQARSGRPTKVDVSLWSVTGPVTDGTVAVEASFDAGQTWQSVDLRRGQLLIDPPVGTSAVSLRATADDGSGNTVTQTIIDAYGVSA
ncbi:S8 family serine peptidase [Stackebrandtia endophytica]|nr:S8 family serine peptidase [Stackebrandtia endophytica]